jgi:hypothetical protein
MRAALYLAVRVLTSVLMPTGVTAEAHQLAGSATAVSTGASIVHVQPRADNFAPKSPANQAEQRKLSAFDAKRQRLDTALDEKLNICRC